MSVSLTLTGKRGQQVRAGLVPSSPPHCLLFPCSELCTLSHPASLTISSLWVTPGSCWGHHVFASLWAASSSPRYFSHSLSGLGARTPGFPPASWCRAALQATRESLGCFPSSCVGRAFAQGWDISEIPGGMGWGHCSPCPHSTLDSSLPASDLAWGQAAHAQPVRRGLFWPSGFHPDMWVAKVFCYPF